MAVSHLTAHLTGMENRFKSFLNSFFS